ncbi:hypothetical protein FHETE_6930 [Fusarium heterosporum]|uniref:2EXR domain-containing protein n=1 Tax=Fusarium heterosporum TaxID=42747 RepID=A0A8H5T8Z8_FUSHE|nr:hypothetical protein FHETE_6930 [Fusarium heterosporum]
MASPAFHLFSSLPYDIRLLVWEKAIHRYHDDRRGLHYVTLDRDRIRTDKSIRCLYPLNRSWDPSCSVNRSAYLYDEGLWTACKESREIIKKQWGREGWPGGGRPEIEARSHAGGALERYGRCNGSVVIHIDYEYEPKRLIFYPRRDLFCISEARWGSLVRHWGGFWHNIQCSLALEFRPCWNLELAKVDNYYPIKKFSHSLGFLIRALLDLMQPFSRHQDTKLRLIDRNANWTTKNPDEGGCVYYDSEHEYVDIEVDPASTSQHLRRIDGPSQILDFLDHVDRLLKSRFTWFLQHNCGDIPVDMEFSVRKMVILVVRLDNRVMKRNG